jgi:hypothetical protein
LAGYGDEVPTPFDGYQFKWLRRTAVALMRQAGLEPEYIAKRLGHADVGDLVLTVYWEVDEEVELFDVLAELGHSLGAAIARRRPRPAPTRPRTPTSPRRRRCHPAGAARADTRSTQTPRGRIDLKGRSRGGLIVQFGLPLPPPPAFPAFSSGSLYRGAQI